MGLAIKKSSSNSEWIPLFESVLGPLHQSLQGQKLNVEIALACLLSRGHLLIEGPPGAGKTTFAKALSETFRGKFSRIQMTPDLLPNEILGTLRLNPKEQNLEFRPGPLFANFVLADELNRSSPKTQSALLEAMAESKITIDGTSHLLPRPFFVVATQNPLESEGVFPLIESQLDRFSAQILINYPEARTEFEIQKQKLARSTEISQVSPVTNSAFVFEKLADLSKSTFLSEEILKYIVDLADKTRTHTQIVSGISTRALSQYIEFLKAFARIQKRDFVLPDDIELTFTTCFTHRITLQNTSATIEEKRNILIEILGQTPSPV